MNAVELAAIRKRAVQASGVGNPWPAVAVSLLDEIGTLRQALWDVYGELGADQDGDKTPDALVQPPLGVLVLRAARELRAEYDELLPELPSVSAE